MGSERKKAEEIVDALVEVFDDNDIIMAFDEDGMEDAITDILQAGGTVDEVADEVKYRLDDCTFDDDDDVFVGIKEKIDEVLKA